MNTNIQQHIEQAIMAIENMPDEYKKIAFQVILTHLLSSSQEKAPERTIERHRTSERPNINKILNSDYDWSSTNIPNLKPSLQNLYILKIAKKQFDVNGLSPKDIQAILEQKFRISKTHNAVSMLLMHEVGKYIDRVQEGKKFLYKITDKGIAYLNSEIQKMKGESR